MRTPYRPNPQKYVEYYTQQGKGAQFFQGMPYQAGYGIGNILSGLFRTAVPFFKPILKSGAQILKQEALKTGKDIVKDMLLSQGKVPAKKILSQHAKRGLKRGIERMVTGKGYKRRKIQCATPKYDDILD